MYKIRMGVPEMRDFWSDLKERVSSGTANKNDVKLHKKLGKAFYHLSLDPFYPA